MVSTRAARRMAQNEMVFREYNERIQRGFDELVQLAKQEGKSELSYDDNAPLHFYCECSDEKCEVRIMLTPRAYAHIHEQRNRFVVVKGHNIPAIERVVHANAHYSVVEKQIELPKSAPGLQDTVAEQAKDKRRDGVKGG